ncbi:GEVED domain-containing protein [Fluviicola sp.]|uniref:GEVED domain-containing protein n=1 Tax=Fluviicola sp. TaxID=1917219 RepID=UPI0031E492CA
MNKKLLWLGLFCLFSSFIYGQTVINTTHPNNNGNGSVTFNVQNTNAFDIIITGIQCHLGSTATNNIELLYNTSPYVDNAAPWSFGTVGAGQNGWISAGTGVVSNSNTANGIVPCLTSLSLTIPAGATYQLGLSATTMQYSTLTNGAGTNTFSGGGVNILTGDGISWGGTVYPSTPANYPRGLIGGITFIPAVPCTSPPTAGTVSAANNPICPSVNNTLSILGGTGGTGQTYQWQSSTTGAAGSFTNIAGATNSTYISNQTVDTYYRVYMTCSGMSDTSAAFLVNTSNFVNCYCNSNATSTGDEEILNVSIGTLNNSSTCSSTGGTGSIQNQYSNYTALPAPTLARTVSYGLNVGIGTCGGNYSNMTKVYIDYNHNGLFSDPGEEVYASPTYTVGPHNEIGTVLVPVTATLGITRMRVINVETTVISNITPCGTYTWGETEDYFVNIAPAPTCPQPTGLTNLGATSTDIELGWTAGGSETSWQLQYGPPGFVLGTGDSVVATTNPFTLGSLTPNSFYQVYVMAVCSATDSSYYTGPITFNTYNQGIYIDWSTDCPAGGFVDISATGTNTNTTDDSEFGLTLPFPVLYQGTLINDITIGNNGGVVLGNQTAQVGYTMAAGNGLYPYVQDMNTPYDGVYFQTLGVAPNRKFVVMWSDVAHFFSSLGTDGTTFELIIDEATNEIYYVYEDVNHDNASYDNGADAEIGVRGAQNIDVSMNNSAYLQENTCVHFYYTDCPKPKNVVTTYLGADEIQFGWTPGFSNETNWIIEYGPAGFTPGTGTILNETNSFSSISSLTQLTDYTLYIYANCANGDTSLALIHNFTTLPYCSNPASINGASDPDSLEVTWSWTASSLAYPVTGFNIQYGMTGFQLGSGTIYQANGINYADTIFDASLMGSGVYQVYVQAECDNGTTVDTSGWMGPITIVMPITNDDVCSQEALQLGETYTFNNVGAGVSLNEANIAPPATGAQMTDGWVNTTLNGTLWYSFVAPASGSVRINSTSVPYNGQAAVYTAINCADFNTFALVAANDDEIGGTSLAPNFTVCGLTPGNTYYVMYDKFDGTTGNFGLMVSAIVLEGGSALPLTSVCTGELVDLFTTITGNNAGGVWSSSIAAVNASIQDSTFNTAGLAYQTFDLQYRVTDGCAYDSIVSQVRIYPLSNAGQDGVITACRNEPIDLLAGLNGNTDLNGDWYDPSDVLLPNSQVMTANFPGQYNYDYISGNGVCPDDTANVVVTVTNCNWLSVDENALEQVTVYPNPSTGVVFIESTFTGSFNLVVTDINGRTIQSGTSVAAGTNTVSLKEVERGTYFFKLSTESAEKVFRVVIQ